MLGAPSLSFCVVLQLLWTLLNFSQTLINPKQQAHHHATVNVLSVHNDYQAQPHFKQIEVEMVFISTHPYNPSAHPA